MNLDDLRKQFPALARPHTDLYILDEQGAPVPCPDLLDWGMWMQRADNPRRVSEDFDEGDAGKQIRISTVFLGLDHNYGEGPPVLWETVVFGGVLDGEMERYTSRQAALDGHQAMCLRVRATIEKKITP